MKNTRIDFISVIMSIISTTDHHRRPLSSKASSAYPGVHGLVLYFFELSRPCAVFQLLVLSRRRLTCPVLSRHLSSRLVMSCPFLSRLDLSCLDLSCLVPSRRGLSCLALSYLVLSCPIVSSLGLSVLSFLVLSCRALACHVWP